MNPKIKFVVFVGFAFYHVGRDGIRGNLLFRIAILGFISLSGELGGPGKRSRALGTVSSGPPPRPGACQLRQCTGVFFVCFLLAFAPGVGPLSGTSPSPVRRGLAGGEFKSIKLHFCAEGPRWDLLRFYR